MELQLHNNTVWFYGAGHPDPAKPTVVFVHGAAMDHTVWTLPVRYFIRHSCNVMAVDLPGHGRSGGAPLPDIPAMAEWLAAVIRQALPAAARVALVGHSMGSLVTLEAAARTPELVCSLSLLGSAVPMAVTDELLDNARGNKHAAIDMLTLWGYSKRAQLGGNKVPGMWMVGGTLRLLERAAPGVLFADLNACNEYRHGLDSAAAIQCPTLLILGRQDMMTPPARAAALERAIPEVRTVLLDDCGHIMTAEQPDKVLDALISNIRTQSPE